MLGIGPVDGIDDRVGHVHVERLLAACLARTKHVERHPRDNRGEPPAEVLDRAGVGAAEANPGLLHRVVRLAQRAQHPVRDGSQVRPLFLELWASQS